MRNLVIGTAGHIDHGKTELIKALTGVDTDRLKEEKARGISIDLGFARFPLEGEDLLLGVVDVPGHEAFIRNMLAGVTGIDLVLFIVAADEGVMPQTIEHLDILGLLGVKKGILVVTKSDLVEEDWLELVVEEGRELVRGTFLENAPVVVTSTRAGRGLDELKEKILQVAREAGPRPAEDVFRLPIDRVFTIKGMGTVVTGTIWSGSIGQDEMVIVHPVGKRARVKGIQVHSEERERADAGSRVALALSGPSRGEMGRGSTAVGLDEWVPSMMLDVFVTCLQRNTRAIENRSRIRFHLATQEVMGRIVLLEGARLREGESGYAQLRLEKPVVARQGDRFVIRSYSPVTTIGGGTVLIPSPRKRPVADREGLAHLETLRSGTSRQIVESVVRESRQAGYPAARLPVDAGLVPGPGASVVEALKEKGVVQDFKGELFHRSSVEEMRGRILRSLEMYHGENPLLQGVKREELRHRIGDLSSGTLLDGVLGRLIEEGLVEVAGGEVKLVAHRIVLRDDMGEMADSILALLSAEPLSPPDPGKLSAKLGVDRGKLLGILSALQKIGQVVKIEESIWLSTEAMAAASRRVEEYLTRHGKGTASGLREYLNVSRKYAIPILEHLDRVGLTYRKGDCRYLKK